MQAPACNVDLFGGPQQYLRQPLAGSDGAQLRSNWPKCPRLRLLMLVANAQISSWAAFATYVTSATTRPMLESARAASNVCEPFPKSWVLQGLVRCCAHGSPVIHVRSRRHIARGLHDCC